MGVWRSQTSELTWQHGAHVKLCPPRTTKFSYCTAKGLTFQNPEPPPQETRGKEWKKMAGYVPPVAMCRGAVGNDQKVSTRKICRERLWSKGTATGRKDIIR